MDFRLGQIFSVPEELKITCIMGSHNLPDMYALSPWACGPRASGINIRQIPPAHVLMHTVSIVDKK